MWFLIICLLLSLFMILLYFLCYCAVSVICLRLLYQHINIRLLLLLLLLFIIIVRSSSYLMWRCVYRASYYNLLMTNEMHNSYNQFLFHSFCLLYMFRTNLVVHHQEHDIIYCVIQCISLVINTFFLLNYTLFPIYIYRIRPASFAKFCLLLTTY